MIIQSCNIKHIYNIRNTITLDSGNCFSIDHFKASNLLNTDREVSLSVLFVPTCRMIVLGQFLINDFRKSCISSTVAPGNIRTLILCFIFPMIFMNPV